MEFSIRTILCAGCILFLATGCAAPTSGPIGPTSAPMASSSIAVLNRVTWGVNYSTVQQAAGIGIERYLERQLSPGTAQLPPAVQAQLAVMTINQRPMDQLVFELEQRHQDADAMSNDDDKKVAREAYQQELNRLAREAATRALLRAIYSPSQLQEQMTWFWMNHFSIHEGKRNLRAMVGDFEERAIRPYALGKFRDLLSATVHHPAMLIYLDNAQNALKHVNENYARELMELHTLGVDGGYTQHDVQELARVLTGVGVNLRPGMPKLRHELQAQYVRQGLFEFNPGRHDYGAKQFLGQAVRAHGLAELDAVIDQLSRQRATARSISRKLAQYFVADEVADALVERMAKSFLHSDGDIAATLRTLFASAEFAASLTHQFKDPLHYLVSSVRLAYDDKIILNAGPLLNWLKRMGEPLYGRQTPDGYPLTQVSWASPGQMTTRFEIARAIGSGSAGLFKTDGAQAVEQAAFPLLSNALYFQSLQPLLSPATRHALDLASSPQEWNTYFLAAPEMMHR